MSYLTAPHGPLCGSLLRGGRKSYHTFGVVDKSLSSQARGRLLREERSALAEAAPGGGGGAPLIKFLGDAKLSTPGAGCRSWPRSAGQPRLLRPENANCHAGHREVGWEPAVRFGARQRSRRANPAVVRARGMAAERAGRAGGHPMSMKKNCETNPITSQESSWFPRLKGKGTKAIRRPAGPAVRPSLADLRPLSRPSCGVAGTDSHGRTDPPAYPPGPFGHCGHRIARSPSRPSEAARRPARRTNPNAAEILAISETGS
jgi:hypothetical protein